VQRAGASVQRLTLDAEVLTPAHDSEHTGEYAANLAVGLAACRSLTELELTASLSDIPIGCWLTPLARTLRRLSIYHDGNITVSASLAALTALQELHLGLYSNETELGQRARLPASLTSLSLGSMEATVVPTQVRHHQCMVGVE